MASTRSGTIGSWPEEMPVFYIDDLEDMPSLAFLVMLTHMVYEEEPMQDKSNGADGSYSSKPTKEDNTPATTEHISSDYDLNEEEEDTALVDALVVLEPRLP